MDQRFTYFFYSLEYVSTFVINKDLDHSLSNENEDESDIISYLSEAINGESNSDILKNIEIKGDTSTKQTNKQDVSIKIPFISQVSCYIDQIKLEYKKHEQYLKSLNTEISILENKNSTLENNLRETINKNNNILAHLQWYDFLKQDLSDNYNLNLDEEIKFFSSIVND